MIRNSDFEAPQQRRPGVNHAFEGLGKEQALQVEIGFFSKMPNMFFGSGRAAKLGVNASLVFLSLFELANRNSNNTFRVSDRTLAADTGISTRTICDIRKRLIEEKLIICVKEPGRSFIYTLPKFNFKWVAVGDRQRAQRRPRGLRSVQAFPQAKFAVPLRVQ